MVMVHPSIKSHFHDHIFLFIILGTLTCFCFAIAKFVRSARQDSDFSYILLKIPNVLNHRYVDTRKTFDI